MSQHMLKKWRTRALALEQPLDQLPASLESLGAEAQDVGWFCENHWDPEQRSDGSVLRPGLSSAARQRLFDRRIGAEILELHEALLEAQQSFRLLAQGGEDAEMDRAHFLLSELQAVLSFLSVEDHDAVDVERLAILMSLYEDAATRTDVASALQNYSTFAAMYRSSIDGLGGFELGMIGEALEVASKLRRRARGIEGVPARELWAALQLRNRIATLLCERLNRAKVLVRFAFRRHPEMLRGMDVPIQRPLGPTPMHSLIRELNGSLSEGDIQDLAL